MSLLEIRKVLQNISKAPGAAGVTITGGEPLLRDDVPEIVSLCREAGLKAAIATNGTLLTVKTIKELVSSGIEHFDIGFTEASTETRLALAGAVKTGCSVTASICVHNDNFKRTGVLCKIAAAMGANAISFNRFVPTGRGILNAGTLQLDRENLLTALRLADKAAEEAGISVYAGIPVEPCIASCNEFPRLVFSTCQCGSTKWAIDPYGNLRTCEQNNQVLGNLLENSFTSIINNKPEMIQQFREWRPLENCSSCSFSDICHGGCRFRI